MNVIVTDSSIEYTDFLKVGMLKDAESIVGTIDFFVYHKSSEDVQERLKYLSKIHEKAKNMIYIRKEEYVEKDVQIMITGYGGKYFDDEFFLESKDELIRLVSSLDDVTALVELGGVDVLTDFFDRYLNGSSSGFNKNYLSVVKEAVNTLLNDYNQKNMDIIELSETATEIFTSSANIVSKVEEEQTKLKSLVDKLQSSKESLTAMDKSIPKVPSVIFFPRIQYLKERSILRIKDIGWCPYLVSFTLGLSGYLEKIKNLSPKLVVILPVGSVYETRYKDFTWITSSNSNVMSSYSAGIVFTNNPTRDIVFRLLDDSKYNVFIILDMLKISKEHILNCKGSSVKYAVTGNGMLSKYSISAVNSFSSIISVKGSMFTIPFFIEYPDEPEQRERMYLRNCTQHYETLYKDVRRT